MRIKYYRSLLENWTLAVAILVLGIMAGFFWTYTFNVNLAMLQVDGEVYARVQSLFNQNVRHFMFFLFFFGGGFFTFIAVLANLKQWRTLSFWLIALALVIYVVSVIAFTHQVNLPLNFYTESWQPSALPSDWMTTRNSWNDANVVRVAGSFLAFFLCVAALVLRASKPHTSEDHIH